MDGYNNYRLLYINVIYVITTNLYVNVPNFVVNIS